MPETVTATLDRARPVRQTGIEGTPSTLVEHEHFARMLTLYKSFLGLLATVNISCLSSAERPCTGARRILKYGFRTIVRGISHWAEYNL
jgi:hypothetical protein